MSMDNFSPTANEDEAARLRPRRILCGLVEFQDGQRARVEVALLQMGEDIPRRIQQVGIERQTDSRSFRGAWKLCPLIFLEKSADDFDSPPRLDL
jgi:hypothetical protein